MRFLALLFVLLFVACTRSMPTHYYLLESSAKPVQSDNLPVKSLRIARINMPEYLDRSEIVSRVDGQLRLVVAQFDIWAEPLGQGIRRMLREELAPRLFVSGVDVRGVGADDGDVVLFLDIQKFDGVLGEKACLEVRWALKSRRDIVLGQGSHMDEEPVKSAEYADFVRAQSVLLSRFALRLAEILPTLMQKEKY